MKKNIIISLIIIAIIIILIVFASIFGKDTQEVNSNSQKLETINVSEVTRSVFYSPQYVAIKKGFFEENGLKIELITGQGADAVMTSVLSNQVQIGFAGPEASIYVYNEGKEDHTEVFAQLTKRDGSFLVSRNNTDNFNWQDLKGKTVIPGRKGGVPYMTLEYVLKKNGINPEKDLILDDSISFDHGTFGADLLMQNEQKLEEEKLIKYNPNEIKVVVEDDEKKGYYNATLRLGETGFTGFLSLFLIASRIALCSAIDFSALNSDFDEITTLIIFENGG